MNTSSENQLTQPTRRRAPGGGRKSHRPTAITIRQAGLLSYLGIPQNEIAEIVGVSPKTLRKHYRNQLSRGFLDTLRRPSAAAQIAGSVPGELC